MSKAIKNKVRQKIISQHGKLFSESNLGPNDLKEKIFHISEDILRYECPNLTSEERNKVIIEIVDELTGFGPVEALLKDPLVTEIMINGPKKIYAEKKVKQNLPI